MAKSLIKVLLLGLVRLFLLVDKVSYAWNIKFSSGKCVVIDENLLS